MVSELRVPIPTSMPVDKKSWLSLLHISNFHNTYYQYRDIRLCTEGRKILLVGPGQGLEVAVLRSRGYEVLTYDIDAEFKPDRVGSVHDLSEFKAREFDIVIASHVLEHMSFAFFDQALQEIARVGQHALIYLPYAGRHYQAFGRIWNISPFWRETSLEKPLHSAGQHFWEIGLKGYSRSFVQEQIARRFEILDAYQNPYWMVSMNFVLRSKKPGNS